MDRRDFLTYLTALGAAASPIAAALRPELARAGKVPGESSMTSTRDS